MKSSDPLAAVYLLDGGLGTTLADIFNVTFDDSTPLWSSQLLLTDPETLTKAQTAFANAGADVILTVTYQASFEGFARSSASEEEAERCMRHAVQLARGSFGQSARKGKVALSLGAYGATMLPGQEYSGKYDAEHMSVQSLREWHLSRINAFLPRDRAVPGAIEREECWKDVDLVAFETLPLLKEVEAVREVMADVSSLLPADEARKFWICCVFPGEQNLLPDESTIRDVVRAMLWKKKGSATPMGIGMNCTKVPKVEGLIDEFEAAIQEMIGNGEIDEWPALVLYPDGTSGEVYNTTTHEWEMKSQGHKASASWDETLYDIVSRARERRLWKSIYVGGCCKVTPIDIAKLRKKIDEN